MGPDAMTLVFWMLSFKSAVSFSSFTFIKGLLSFSSFSAIRMVSSPYLRLLIFLLKSSFQLIIHPTWHFAWCALFSSSPELCLMPAWHFAWCIPTDLFIHTISRSPCPFSNTYTHTLSIPILRHTSANSPHPDFLTELRRKPHTCRFCFTKPPISGWGRSQWYCCSSLMVSKWLLLPPLSRLDLSRGTQDWAPCGLR